MNEQNHGAALAGLFSALDALGRAESFGGFHYPSPESEAIAKAKQATQDALHVLLAEKSKADAAKK